jgi:hypothetical protein
MYQGKYLLCKSGLCFVHRYCSLFFPAWHLPSALRVWTVNVTATAIDEVRVRGDSCGGEVTCLIRCCPKGLGSPVFDKLEAELTKALMSLPASKVRPHCNHRPMNAVQTSLHLHAISCICP